MASMPPTNGSGDPFAGMTLPSTPIEALTSLVDEGIGLDTLLGETEGDLRDNEGTRAGERVPGIQGDEQLKLSSEQEKVLAKELCELAEEYFRAMGPRRIREDEIRDAYALLADPTHSGQASDSSRMSSEMITSYVNQASSRLVTNINSVKPLIRVDPIAGAGFGTIVVSDLAASTEAFLNEYSMREVDLRHLLPAGIQRATKVGTAVFRVEWKEQSKTTRFYTESKSEPTVRKRKTANVHCELIDNANVIVWPPTILNWQRDYEVVGHRSYFSRSRWRERAKQLGLDEEKIKSIEAFHDGPDESTKAEGNRQGIDTGQMRETKLLGPEVQLTELWCHMLLPDGEEPERFQVILHEPSQEILWIDYNRHFCQKHPYYPLRYQWGERFAWGTGVGDQALPAWAADTAMRNLEIDNLRAGAFYIVCRKAGSVYNTMLGPPGPGMEVVMDDPTGDLIPKKMGGEAPELMKAIMENTRRGREATGLASVLAGMGDPTMKSGGGSGSTMALIEQASMQVRYSDSCLREDLSDLLLFILELVAQYGTDGLFYRFADPKDADQVKLIRYRPPRGGEIAEMFRIRVQAPSASTSEEARKNSYMQIWLFAQQAVGMLTQFVMPILQQENPAAIPRWMHSVAVLLREITRRVVEYHQLPGIEEYLPEIPEQTPEDQMINFLNQQLQEAQGMIQGLQQQLQQLMQPQPEMPMQGMPMHGQGMEQMEQMGGPGGALAAA